MLSNSTIFCSFEQVINNSMRKLSPQEFEQLTIKGKGRSSYVFTSILNLKEGEALLIEKKDWQRKAGPSTLVRYIEKRYKGKFLCAAVEDGKGWAVKRIASSKPETKIVKPEPIKKEEIDKTDLELKSELTLFYLARIAVNKIEKIEDSLKASITHFWKADTKAIQKYFPEIIKGLNEQGHIVIEGDKTYVPLRNKGV